MSALETAEQKGRLLQQRSGTRKPIEKGSCRGGRVKKYGPSIAHVKEKIAVFIRSVISGQILLSRSEENDRRKHTRKK